MITVERVNVGPRFVERSLLTGGRTMLCEGVEFRASCGCLIVIGLRVDAAQEKVIGYVHACARHTIDRAMILGRISAPEAPAIDTEEWIAQVLNEAGS